MAYYDALVAEWSQLTPGTTAAKLAQINAMTITGTIPTSFYVTGNQVLNCIGWTEFNALTAQQQNNILGVCRTPGLILGGASTFMGKMFVATFTNLSGPTITALTALAQAVVTPWWQANGYTSPFTQADLTAAGNLT
jgi:hypothetical protein